MIAVGNYAGVVHYLAPCMDEKGDVHWRYVRPPEGMELAPKLYGLFEHRSTDRARTVCQKNRSYVRGPAKITEHQRLGVIPYGTSGE
jgi:hypothetical protein